MKRKSIMRKNASCRNDGSPVFVDLSNVEMMPEVPSVTVRVAEVRSKDDILRMKESAAKGHMIIFDTSGFADRAGGPDEARKAVRALASETNTAHYDINESVSILVQQGMRMERVRIVRKDGDGR